MKIDVESMEPEVIIGGQTFLKSVNVTAIQMEMGVLKERVEKTKRVEEEKIEVIGRMLKVLKNLKYVGINGDDRTNWIDPVVNSSREWSWDVIWIKDGGNRWPNANMLFS